MNNKGFSALVLAGDRGKNDPLVVAADVPGKALAPVCGQAVVLRVLAALRAEPRIGRIVLVGPHRAAVDSSPELTALINTGQVQWLPPESGPSASAATGLKHLLADGQPVLVTTADHALLDQSMVGELLDRAAASDADALVMLARKAEVIQAFPGAQRTGLRFRDDVYCGCNLFAMLTPQARAVVEFWQQVEHLRKQPVKLISAIGGWTALRFRLGWLSLDQGLAHLQHKTGVRVRAVIASNPLAAVDVDSVNDWHQVNHWLEQRMGRANSDE
ncbi:MAG: nucleotidyltransferase family protein [Wenzhouxiangellaceae bacterium]